MDQNNTTFISRFISDGLNNILSIRNFYDTILTSDTNNSICRIPINDFFLKYHKELENCIQVISLDEKYFYKPKTLSLALYDTTELWLSLLRLNSMKNITDFHLPTIKVYNPSDIKEYINIFFKRENKIC